MNFGEDHKTTLTNIYANVPYLSYKPEKDIRLKINLVLVNHVFEGLCSVEECQARRVYIVNRVACRD